MPNEQFRHAELTEVIIGTFYEVYNELGHGFLESVYESSLAIALRTKGFEVHQQIAIPVFFRGSQAGDFDADLLVNRTGAARTQGCKKCRRFSRRSASQLFEGDRDRSWSSAEFRFATKL